MNRRKWPGHLLHLNPALESRPIFLHRNTRKKQERDGERIWDFAKKLEATTSGSEEELIRRINELEARDKATEATTGGERVSLPNSK
ncbi:hypothetical protein SLEP1_g40741 [Rubroshorea leprosula]|uniref:Uncharacterized protein n=1 Tax=Rubroshorea leprosula TaxID=152421 RepID=A0AAV5L5Q6_9ROSI|nr:hypothetical protein SLEP1_g40741 [Rubroshorea leprosula]